MEKIAGKNIVIAIYDQTGTNLYAVGGQQGLTVNRSAENIDTSDKLSGGWASGMAGLKKWSIDTDGGMVEGDPAKIILDQAFENSDTVAVKVINIKTGKALYGGLATISDFSVEAPHDDVVAWSATLEGAGPLADLSGDAIVDLPVGITVPINDLVAVQGSTAGQIALTFSPLTGSTAVAVETKTGVGTWTVATTTPTSIGVAATSAVITGLTTGVTYSVRLVVTGGLFAGNSNVAIATAK
ncbi:MAG: antigen A [Fusobacteria bacterium]|nr:MAG: antigen A [Fusobacteriota bacterium]KAF0228978.1 MAG: antigen [Fusobacteriota bacterium]